MAGLGNFFEFNNNLLIEAYNQLTNMDYQLFNHLSVDPSCIYERVDLSGVYSRGNGYIDKVTGKKFPLLKSDNNFTNFYNKYFKEIVRIDFSRDYDDRILVHSAAGGGSSSRECFNFFKLSNAVSAYIKIKIEEIGSPYHAVMIRNTDYKTDYISLFETIKKDLGSNTLLISSDDLECVNFARAYFFRNKVVNFSNLPSHNTGKPLLSGHYKHSIDQKILNLDALTDLFLSASANKLYPSYIKSLNGEYLKPGMQSGFQKLAIYLHENRALLNSVTNFN